MSSSGPQNPDAWRRPGEDQPSAPTGWERPGSGPSSASGSSPNLPQPNPSVSPDWPGYPPSGQPSAPEPTRSYPLDPSTGPNAGYHPYDQQSMPAYGSGQVESSTGGYGTNPYETNPYQQNPYQPYGAYQAYAVPPQHPKATTAFVLGLLGLVVCPPVGIAGLVMGGRARREIDASGGQLSGRGLATAGWVLGIISVVSLALIVAYIIFVIIAIAASSTQ